MNNKQELFCQYYAMSGNASESYRKAGYGSTNANSISVSARRLLQNPIIKQRIQELSQEAYNEKIAQASEIQEHLTSILRGELQEEVVVVEGVDKGISEARIIKKRPSNADRIKAGTTLAKMQGVYENVVNVKVAVPVIGGETDLEN